MKISKISIIFIVLILISLLIQIKAISIDSNCLVHSEINKLEYLYRSKDDNVNTISLKKVQDFERISWNLIPSEKDHNGVIYYLIKNKMTNDFLCGTYIFKTISGARRRVNLINIPTNDLSKIKMDKCQWSLINIESNGETKNRYFIVNKYFKEPLYSETNLFFNFRSNYRNVYLWSWRITNSMIKGFIWFVDCKNGAYLLE